MQVDRYYRSAIAFLDNSLAILSSDKMFFWHNNMRVMGHGSHVCTLVILYDRYSAPLTVSLSNKDKTPSCIMTHLKLALT